MKRTVAAITFGALVAFSPLAAMAQSAAPTQGEQVAQADTAAPATPRGSHSRHMRSQRNLSRERARASAEHMRTRHHHAPAAPKS